MEDYNIPYENRDTIFQLMKEIFHCNTIGEQEDKILFLTWYAIKIGEDENKSNTNGNTESRKKSGKTKYNWRKHLRQKNTSDK